jgi:hypothetical protein
LAINTAGIKASAKKIILMKRPQTKLMRNTTAPKSVSKSVPIDTINEHIKIMAEEIIYAEKNSFLPNLNCTPQYKAQIKTKEKKLKISKYSKLIVK